jgi:hypothetical protein
VNFPISLIVSADLRNQRTTRIITVRAEIDSRSIVVHRDLDATRFYCRQTFAWKADKDAYTVVGVWLVGMYAEPFRLRGAEGNEIPPFFTMKIPFRGPMLSIFPHQTKVS